MNQSLQDHERENAIGEKNRRKKLLIMTSTYPRWAGDPEPGFVHELAVRLNATYEVVVLAPHANSARSTEILDGVRVHRYHYAPSGLETLVNDGGIVTNLRKHRWKLLLVPGFLIAMTWNTWRLVAKYRPDIIHAHWLMPQGLSVALLGLIDRRIPPFLVTSHGADLYALRSRLFQVLKRFVAKRAAAISVVSTAMKVELSRISGETIEASIQPMGVDLHHRFTPDASCTRSKSEILFVGRLVEKKGLRHLIDAMPHILSVRPDAVLTVVGFGPELPALEGQIQRLRLTDHVRFAGAVTQRELPSYYRRAAVFVAPFVEAPHGDQEGLGLVVVEAMGCGCPVIASNIAGVRQIVDPPEIAILVEPGSHAALAKAVIATLQNPVSPERTGRNRDAINSRFEWSQVAEGYRRTLDRICP